MDLSGALRSAAVLLAAILPCACVAITGLDSLVESGEEADAGSSIGADARTDSSLGRDATQDHALGEDAGPDVSSRSDAMPATDSSPCAPPALLFDEEFDGGTLDTVTRWAAAGDGIWSIEGGVGVQSNPNASAVLYARAFVGATDYRIVVRMASTGPFGIGQDLAPEIAFRTNPAVDAGGIPETYHCNFDLLDNQLILMQTLPDNEPVLSTLNLSLPSNFDPSTPFVLEAVAKGSDVTCSLMIDGIGSVGSVSTMAVTRASGTFGLKTYETMVTIDYVRVYGVVGCE